MLNNLSWARELHLLFSTHFVTRDLRLQSCLDDVEGVRASCSNSACHASGHAMDLRVESSFVEICCNMRSDGFLDFFIGCKVYGKDGNVHRHGGGVRKVKLPYSSLFVNVLDALEQSVSVHLPGAVELHPLLHHVHRRGDPIVNESSRRSRHHVSYHVLKMTASSSRRRVRASQSLLCRLVNSEMHGMSWNSAQENCTNPSINPKDAFVLEDER
mmetsp:Transcript_8352/g.28067  ORF Transcript_8352/g.28067 Transcript_8352/m.28067 type:complete len:214 (-) Transcript_8352:375-1016(-)